MSHRKYIVFLILITVLFASLSLSLPKVELRNVREVVEYPLPALPEIAVWNGELIVKAKASQSAKDWKAWLVSKHGTYSLELTSSEYSEEMWILTFKVPSGIPPILYDLKISFSDNGEREYVQPRSVSILKEWPEKLKIGHLTDIHFPGGAQIYARCVYELNLIRPHLVVATGDVVDVDTIKSAWVYNFFLSRYWKVPFYSIPGNHDHAGDDAANYQKFAGPLYWYTRIGPYLVIAFDTAADGYVTKEQLEWAEKILSQNPDTVKIMAFHHPIFNYPGGEIEVDLENIEKVKHKMYSSWAEHLEEASILVRMIANYDVRLILSGHIHSDTVVVMNGRHYFLIKEPSGGSVREGSHYPSYRIVYVSKTGEVEPIMYQGRDLFEYPNSLPVGNILYYYTPANDGSSSAISLRVDSGLKTEIPIVAEFKVKAGEEYKIYGVEDYEVESYEVEGGVLYLVKTTIPVDGKIRMTLAAADDNSPPKVEAIELDEESKRFVIKTSDEGWGVADVTVEISVNGGEWKKVDAVPLVLIDRDEGIVDVYEKPEFAVEVPGTGTIKLRVKAVDFAGNVGEEVVKSFKLGEEKPEEKPEEGVEKPPPELPTETILIAVLAVLLVVLAVLVVKRRRS